jgi:hypothetical protein
VTKGTIPHLSIVVGVSCFVLVGFACVSAWILGWSSDEVTKGNIIGTWQNFALLAVGFWLGSSSGGKVKDQEPVDTRIVNAPNDPVPIEQGDKP